MRQMTQLTQLCVTDISKISLAATAQVKNSKMQISWRKSYASHLSSVLMFYGYDYHGVEFLKNVRIIPQTSGARVPTCQYFGWWI